MILTEVVELGGLAVMYPEDVLFSVTFSQLALVCCCLPAGAFVICVALAVTLHFEGSTRTHCNVPNYLPSISAAIGDYTPERYVWRLCIALHCLPRFIVAVAYRNFYQSSPLKSSSRSQSMHKQSVTAWPAYDLLCNLVCAAQFLENFSLLALTFVSSTENQEFHEISFIAFTVGAQLYMVLTLIIFNFSGRRRSSTSGKKSYQCKFLLYMVNSASLLVSTYFFMRHNWYCEPGVYTMFALCEYVVVFSNIAFHSTAAIDFRDKVVVMTSSSNLDLKHH